MLPNINRIKNAFKFASLLCKRKLRKLKGLPIIEVIGDSHALLFQGEQYNINYIGPATAYNLGSEQSSNNSRNKTITILSRTKESSPSYYLLVFGEIDTRIHIYNQHKKNNIPIDALIARTVDQYINFINELKRYSPKAQFIICNVFPQGEQENFYKYPFYGDRKIRMEITRKMNEALKIRSKEAKILFIEVFDKLLDQNGDRIKKYIFDEIHFNCDILPFIEEQLKVELPELKL